MTRPGTDAQAIVLMFLAWLRVPLRRLDVDPVFLATVLRHYVEHPEHRGDIGTRAELERLESGFAAWRRAVAPASF